MDGVPVGEDMMQLLRSTCCYEWNFLGPAQIMSQNTAGVENKIQRSLEGVEIKQRSIKIIVFCKSLKGSNETLHMIPHARYVLRETNFMTDGSPKRARTNYRHPETANVPTDHTKPGSCGSPSDIMKAAWAEMKKFPSQAGSQNFGVPCIHMQSQCRIFFDEFLHH